MCTHHATPATLLPPHHPALATLLAVCTHHTTRPSHHTHPSSPPTTPHLSRHPHPRHTTLTPPRRSQGVDSLISPGVGLFALILAQLLLPNIDHPFLTPAPLAGQGSYPKGDGGKSSTSTGAAVEMASSSAA